MGSFTPCGFGSNYFTNIYFPSFSSFVYLFHFCSIHNDSTIHMVITFHLAQLPFLYSFSLHSNTHTHSFTFLHNSTLHSVATRIRFCTFTTLPSLSLCVRFTYFTLFTRFFCLFSYNLQIYLTGAVVYYVHFQVVFFLYPLLLCFLRKHQHHLKEREGESERERKLIEREKICM